MPKILVNVSDGQKGLWVAAAHDERVSLSEWIRRRCDAGLLGGEGEAVVPIGARPGAASRDLRPSPPRSPERSFRPDPKGGKRGLEEGVAGDGISTPSSSPPSPRRSAPVSEQRGKAGSFQPDFKKGAKQ